MGTRCGVYQMLPHWDQKGVARKDPWAASLIVQAVNYVPSTGWETAALTSMARGFSPSQSLSVTGMVRVQGLVDQPCLVPWLRAPCHEVLLLCLPKAMSALCRFPRANAIHTVMIVAYYPQLLGIPIRGTTSAQQKDAWSSFMSPQHLDLLDKMFSCE